MKLRWFVTCDEQGGKSTPSLQYWDAVWTRWVDVPYFECKILDENKFMDDEDAH